MNGWPYRSAVEKFAAAAKPRYTISRTASIADIPSTIVDRLSRGRGVFASGPFLHFMERMRKEKGVWYLTCADTSTAGIVGICPVYEGGASATSYWNPSRHYLRRAEGVICEEAWNPGTFVGIRAGYGWSFLIDPDLGEDATTVLGAMLGEIGKILGWDAATSAMFLSGAGREQLVALGAQDADFLMAGATSVIDVRWSSFEEYVDRLSRPVNTRREIRVFEASGANATVMPLTEARTQIASHLTQLEDKYGGSSTPEAELEEMTHLCETMGDAAKAIVLVRDDQVIGGAVFLEWQGTIYVRQAGFDYAVTGRAFEYFNLIYYCMVRYALRTSAKRIDYGMATYRAKLTRGAVVEPLWGLAIDRNGQVLSRRAGFKAWDQTRRQAVETGTASALEKVELP
jgi:hypothetical protein